MSAPRLSYLESCRKLGELDENGKPPPIPDRMPRHDDEGTLGVSFFRTLARNEDYSNLTLPRTFFGRSEINCVLFRNTDLAESNLCWNDFIDVDFSGAILTASDLRSSIFKNVRFIGSDLRAADLRRSWFEACVFDNANMVGAILTRTQGPQLALLKEQENLIDWRDDEGPEPGGG